VPNLVNGSKRKGGGSSGNDMVRHRADDSPIVYLFSENWQNGTVRQMAVADESPFHHITKIVRRPHIDGDIQVSVGPFSDVFEF